MLQQQNRKLFILLLCARLNKVFSVFLWGDGTRRNRWRGGIRVYTIKTADQNSYKYLQIEEDIWVKNWFKIQHIGHYCVVFASQFNDFTVSDSCCVLFPHVPVPSMCLLITVYRDYVTWTRFLDKTGCFSNFKLFYFSTNKAIFIVLIFEWSVNIFNIYESVNNA